MRAEPDGMLAAERHFLTSLLDAAGLASGLAERIQFTGEGRQRSCFAAGELAAATIAVAGAGVSALQGYGDVCVDRRLAALWFGMTARPLEPIDLGGWDAIAGDYPSRDGWIRLHTNAPHHRAAALSVLACEQSREAVTDAIARVDGEPLEAAIVEAGGCAAIMRSPAEWHSHQQGRAVRAEPLIAWSEQPGGPPADWQPSHDRPLAGLKVLDLTRVLAGPVATRFLASFGAEVLRIDPPDWDEPGVIPEVTIGKRCARLDLRTTEGCETFSRLLAGADVLVHGYRADALDHLGFGVDRRFAIRPGLVDASLDAYGHSGPWAHRRGFDSLVQMSVGIAHEGMQRLGAERPVPLPFQALDQATGYMMAIAVLSALQERRSTGRSICARLSLARTAELLTSFAAEPTDAPAARASASDYSGEPEQTAWGHLHRLHPPLQVGSAVMRWTSPAVPLGSSPPRWQEPIAVLQR